MKRLIVVALICCTCLLPACGDDDPVTPESFLVTLNVRDAEDNPVPGLYLTLLSENPYMQDGKLADTRGAVRVEFMLPVSCDVRLTIEDVAGRLVRNLIDEPLPAGVHSMMWGGRDDEQVHQPSGRYTVRLLASDDGGDTHIEQTTDVLMATTSHDIYSVGATNDQGELKLTDKTLFPHLYDREPMEAMNENGEIMGLITLTPRMRLYLLDPRYGHVERFDRDITHLGQVIDIEWMGVDGPQPQPAAPALKSDKPVVPPQPIFSIRAYPNPFN